MTVFVFLSLKVHNNIYWSNGNFAVDYSRNKAVEVLVNWEQAYGSLLHGNIIN